METIHLDLGEDSYPIYIGPGLMSDPDLIRSHIKGSRVLIVSNETVGPLFLPSLSKALDGLVVDKVWLPDGEKFKTLDVLNGVFDVLLENGHTRKTTILALGGGVVGDMAGFAAACYQRGVAFIQIPTTLLSQVDSSVGGKTAVNHPLGKNMIGAFYQPKAVVIDTDSLGSLPSRELSAGLAEIIKHGALGDLAYFQDLEANMPSLLALEPEVTIRTIKRSCEIKAQIVSEDEKEAGVRALLNFGHTFGHAIESGLGYGEWLHGEAVGAGMVMAADLSMRLGFITADDGQRLRKLIAQAGLPTEPPKSLTNQMMDLMRRDKKTTDAGLNFVVLRELGRAELMSGIDEALVMQTISRTTAGEAFQ